MKKMFLLGRTSENRIKYHNKSRWGGGNDEVEVPGERNSTHLRAVRILKVNCTMFDIVTAP